MAKEIRVPALGESVTEATIAKWFKNAGDAVKADEPLVELETDKVTVEVPAPAAGVLGEIVAAEGTTVGVGALLAVISEGIYARFRMGKTLGPGFENMQRAAGPLAERALMLAEQSSDARLRG